MSYDDLTIKRLYGQTYNECTHPECDRLMIEFDKNTEKPINHGDILTRQLYSLRNSSVKAI